MFAGVAAPCASTHKVRLGSEAAHAASATSVEQTAFPCEHAYDKYEGYYFSKAIPANQVAELLRQPDLK